MKSTFKKALITAVVAATTTFACAQASACTYINFKNGQDNTFTARTQEWPGTMDGKFALVPRGFEGENYTTKYGFVSTLYVDVLHDGMNEHGLQMSMLALGVSQYAPEGSGDINKGEVVGYVLGNFKSVDEAEKALKETKVHNTIFKAIPELGEYVGVHFVITDNKRSIVVEYLDDSGYPNIFENKLGVMTNEPTYDVQEMLANSLLDEGKVRFSEANFHPFDMSIEGRFQKAVAFNHTQNDDSVQTDEQGIARAWTLANTFDIPQGALYWRHVSDVPQFVSWSSVGDIANKRYFYRTYDNMVIREINLAELDFSKVKYEEFQLFGKTEFNKVEFQQFK
ncbi:linear amide C-N hydrolase [Paraferrimonas sedimenticola]|uniref:Choloylglycine hydrolase n=1 Tax=Paraferrimonas sedimenticola TaxID=375674 RepID=A0AA37RV99_9GAMM|nr:linear amide C-N hydrolase [Paraferrimonas sedimenticola]GLP95858.1 choloylglycine hydrolase [Paraferrimonas sedimenticola]